jgi:transposase-like protein
MKRVAKKRALVKGYAAESVRDGLIEELLETEDGHVLPRIREELFGLFQALIEKIMQLELGMFLGYEPYQKVGVIENSRNGYRNRKRVIMKEGVMSDIKVPRDRFGYFKTSVLPRMKAYEPELLDYVQHLYMNCNSTRPLSRIFSELFNWPVSHGQVSTMCKELDDEVKQWMNRPIEDKYIGLFLDAVMLPLRRFHQKCEKECMLIVLGVTADGCKEALGMKLVSEESCDSWFELLNELKSRGLKGKNLVLAVTDGLNGFKGVLLKLFPGLAIQRCIVHKERNVLRYIPHYKKEEVADELKRIYSSSTAEDAIKRKDEFCRKWIKIFPSAVRSLMADFDDSITFLKIGNYQLRKLFYTNNPIERINKEIKRRVKVMEMLPAEESAYRVVYWILQNLTKRWSMYKVRGYAALANFRKEFTH